MGEAGIESFPSQSVGLVDSGVDLAASVAVSLVVAGLLEPDVADEVVAESVSIFEDSILLPASPRIRGEASALLEGPIVDIVELVDCLGGDLVEESILWAYNVLVEGSSEPHPEELAFLADCLGWSVSPGEVDSETAASLVIMSITAAYNKYLARLAARQ